MKGKYSAERLLGEIIKLEPVEFLGVCKILGVKLYGEEEVAEPRDFTNIWFDVCDAVDKCNRTKRKNLGTILYAANKRRDK